MIAAFTPAELEELRRYDAMVDAAPMTYEDYNLLELVEDLLFPELVKRRECSRRRYERNRKQAIARSKARREVDPAREAARKKAWYIANKERVLAQQKEYRKRKSIQQE